MELATVHIKLSGQTQNVVVKKDVTPAQLAVYAFMHGEDCAQSIQVTSIDKNRTSKFEMNRLRMEFTSEHAQKCMNTLYPGAVPQLPVTFQSIGMDPEYLQDENAPPIHVAPPTGAAATIADKIKKADEQRRAEEAAAKGGVSALVSDQALTDLLDDTGGEEGDDDDNLELSDDALDLEMKNLQQAPQE